MLQLRPQHRFACFKVFFILLSSEYERLWFYSAASSFETKPLRWRFLPLTLPNEREERSSTAHGSCTSSTRRLLHAQKKTLRLLLVVSGALHDQRNFSSHEL
ncbi:hypothetical protein R6Z07F_007342 [Ovis aries]